MDNQHRQIKGYRELTQEEIDLMNRVKAKANECGELIAELEAMQTSDQRCVQIAKDNIQQGFMWAVRSITKPTTFG